MSGPAEGLDALALDVDLGSREGLSRDHAARIRAQYLMVQATLLGHQTQFADTKATAVLAFVGVIGGRAAADFDYAALGAVEISLLGLTSLALALCLMVLIPRFPGRAEQARVAASERFSWIALSAPGLSEADYARFVRGAEMSQLMASAAAANVGMARVLAMKFRFLRAAFLAAIAAVALAAALLLGLLDGPGAAAALAPGAIIV